MDVSPAPHLSGLFPEEIVDLLGNQVAAYRGQQIFHWIHTKTCQSFQEMTNLPQQLIWILQNKFGRVLPVQLAICQVSQDGTEKYLFVLEDGNTIEAVLIPELKRNTLCLSTQVGCAMGCTFCATGQAGFCRQLSTGEIVAQVLWVMHALRQRGQALSNLVYMGMGEPLANYQAVLKSVRLLNDARGSSFGARRITISTCGLVPQIRTLALEELQVNLAISLHATDNQLRSQIMPINSRFPIEELLGAADYYTKQTGRRVSFEYALIAGFNDSPKQAQELNDLLRGRLCHVNLLALNRVGTGRPSDSAQIVQFARVLQKGGIPVSIRKPRGADIEAACGQLRQNYARK